MWVWGPDRRGDAPGVGGRDGRELPFHPGPQADFGLEVPVPQYPFVPEPRAPHAFGPHWSREVWAWEGVGVMPRGWGSERGGGGEMPLAQGLAPRPTSAWRPAVPQGHVGPWATFAASRFRALVVGLSCLTAGTRRRGGRWGATGAIFKVAIPALPPGRLRPGGSCARGTCWFLGHVCTPRGS